MKQKVVGRYRLGDERVQLVLREGNGGDFYSQPGDIPYPRIKIGVEEGEPMNQPELSLYELIQRQKVIDDENEMAAEQQIYDEMNARFDDERIGDALVLRLR